MKCLKCGAEYAVHPNYNPPFGRIVMHFCVACEPDKVGHAFKVIFTPPGELHATREEFESALRRSAGLDYTTIVPATPGKTTP